MKIKQNGFTLIETIIVLAVFLSIAAIGSSIPINIIKQQETSQFLNLFQQDILYLQEWNMNESTPAYMAIDTINNRYTIRSSWTGTIILKRNIPEFIVFDLRTLKQPIQYTENGTIKNPGTLFIMTDEVSFKVVFPFGKGRSYIEKQ